MKNCPFCGKEDQGTAVICRFCDTRLDAPVNAAPAATEARSATLKACPFCAEEIQPAAIVCKHCRRDLKSVARPPIAARMAMRPARLAGMVVAGGCFFIATLAGISMLTATEGTVGAAPAAASAGTAAYRVSGSAPFVSVTYQNARGGTEQVATVALPWTYPLGAVTDGQFLYVSAQNTSGGVESVVAEIVVDAVAVKHSVSAGAYTIATASASF